MRYASCKPADTLVLFFTPPYGSMEGGGVLSLLYVILFVILFFCTVTDLSAAEKARGVKFCVPVGLLSGEVFSPLVKIGSRGFTGAAALPRV